MTVRENTASTQAIGLRLRSLTSVLLFFAIWEATARAHLAPPILLPPFTVVAAQLVRVIADGSLLADLILSLYRAFAGLASAAASGVLIGMLMARSRTVHWLMDPIVALGFPSPKIAFLPVFILWFGIESLSKILLVAFACVLPIIIGTYSAARAVNRVLLWSAFSLGTTQQDLLTRVVLPACYPRIFVTLRIALPVHSRNGRGWRRRGCDAGLFAAFLRNPDGVCLHSGYAWDRPRARRRRSRISATLFGLGGRIATALSGAP
jgi:ABC-type nitrate/sulfonate/bicarbonate transport system permease component